MANKMLELILKVKDQASAQLDKIKGSATGKGSGLEGLANSFVKTAAKAGAAAFAIQQVVDAASKQIQEFNDYVLGVNRLGDAFGLTVQEAEKVTLAADAMGVSNDALFSSLNKLAREGLGTGVEALSNLRDEFEAIQDPAERATYLFKMAGEQGQKVLAPLLEMSEIEFDNFMAGMEQGAQLTEDMVAKAEELELAVKNMETAWRNFTNEIVGWAAPGVTQALNNITGASGHMSDSVVRALEATGQSIGEFQRNAAYLELTVEQLANKVTASGQRWAAYEAHLRSVRLESEKAWEALSKVSSALPQAGVLGGYDPREPHLDQDLLGNLGGTKRTRRYYGGGGGGGIGNKDLEELFEDLIEVLEDLPSAVRDAVNRID